METLWESTEEPAVGDIRLCRRAEILKDGHNSRLHDRLLENLIGEKIS